MAEKVLMLALSPTMEEGTITTWHKKEGDSVDQSEILCEVETDKATMEYESVNEGTLLKILVPEGDQAKVGQLIAVVGEPGEDISSLLEEAKAEAAREAPYAGKPASGPAEEAPSKAEAESVRVAASPAEAQEKAEPAVEEVPGRIKASPLARRMAEEMGVDLTAVKGSGPGGRIVKQDLDEMRPAPAAAPTVPAGGPAGHREERIPHSRTRKIIARRLAESKFTAPHFYLKIDVGVERLMAARQALNSRREEGKVSFNAFLLKLAAEALKRHPWVNAAWEEEAIVQFGRIDLGLAVAQKEGLITPVVRDCDRKGIEAIDRELKVLIDKARSGRLRPEEYTGATFTISSLGTFGIPEFTAIINPPGSAILAVGQIRKMPVVDENDRIEIRSKMILTLSCDHRVVDGVVGAAFLSELKAMIEEPIRALY